MIYICVFEVAHGISFGDGTNFASFCISVVHHQCLYRIHGLASLVYILGLILFIYIHIHTHTDKDALMLMLGLKYCFNEIYS